MITFCVNFY